MVWSISGSLVVSKTYPSFRLPAMETEPSAVKPVTVKAGTSLSHSAAGWKPIIADSSSPPVSHGVTFIEPDIRAATCEVTVVPHQLQVANSGPLVNAVA